MKRTEKTKKRGMTDMNEKTESGMMKNETVDVIRRTLELSETVMEAISHFIERTAGGSLEQSSAMLATIGDGMESIEKAFPVIFDESFTDPDVSSKCNGYFARAIDAFDAAVSAALVGGAEELRSRGQSLMSAYKAWDGEANANLRRMSLM